MNLNRLEELLGLLNKTPNDPFLKFGVAMEHVKAKEYPKALNYFNDLVNNHPEYSGTYFHLGKLYERLGKDKLAMDAYQKGMKVTKKNGEQKDYLELKEAFFLLVEDEDEDY